MVIAPAPESCGHSPGRNRHISPGSLARAAGTRRGDSGGSAGVHVRVPVPAGLQPDGAPSMQSVSEAAGIEGTPPGYPQPGLTPSPAPPAFATGWPRDQGAAAEPDQEELPS